MNDSPSLWRKIQTPLIWTLSAAIVGIFLTFITTINSDLAELRSIDGNIEKVLLERDTRRLQEIEDLKTKLSRLSERSNQIDKQLTRTQDMQVQMDRDLTERWGRLKSMINDLARIDERLTQLERSFNEVRASGVIGRMDALEAIVNKLTRSLLVRDPDKRYPYYVNPKP